MVAHSVQLWVDGVDITESICDVEFHLDQFATNIHLQCMPWVNRNKPNKTKEESTMSEGNDLKPLTPNRGAAVHTDDLFAVYPWLDPYLSIKGHSDGTKFAKKLRLAANHVRGEQALEELAIPNAIIEERWEQEGPTTHPVFHGDENGAKDE